MTRINLGYGSILLGELVSLAKDRKIHKIEGWLAAIDVDDHKERLFAYYEKFGFTITASTNENTQRIYEIQLEL